jgi:GTP cyclohydrolase IA
LRDTMNGQRPGYTEERASIVDVEAAEKAAADLLRALGVDPSSPSFTRTPKRVVAAYRELLAPHEFEMSMFPNDSGYRELVVAQAIPFRSLCEHHLLPFFGLAHVGYVPAESILGLSKIARVVEACARGFQVQERMTVQIGTWLVKHLDPIGVGVIVQAQHTCMTVRGIRAAGTTATTLSLHGSLRDDPREQQKFMALARAGVDELG